MEGPAARVLFLGGEAVEEGGPGTPGTLLTTTSHGWKRGPAYGPVLKMDGERTRRTDCRRRGLDIDSLPRFLMPKV